MLHAVSDQKRLNFHSSLYLSAMANYDSNWLSTAPGKIFQTDGVVTTQKYYDNQLSYGVYLVTFDNVALLIQSQNTRAMSL